jgi:probable phosphoglycerate mutase
MLRLYLARHAQTACSEAELYCGHCPQPLTAAGRRQAEALAAACCGISWSALYSSPLPRALETAAIVGRRIGLKPQCDDGLMELDYGSWDGKTPQQLRQQEPAAFGAWLDSPARLAPPGGETVLQLAERAESAVDRIRSQHPDGRVLVVSHKSTIRVLLCRLLGLDVNLYRRRLAQPLGAVNVVEFRSSGPMLVRLGDTSYLPGG